MAEALVLGDSHARALHEGLKAAGIEAEALTTSGAVWHAGSIGYRPRRGLIGRKTMHRFVADLRNRNGGSDLTDGSVPIIASFGFHLGRLVPPFGFHGNFATAEEAGESGIYASHGFVAAYVQHYRRELLIMLSQMSRRAPLVNVAPPVPGRPNYRRFKDVLIDQMTAAGVAVYDPESDIFQGKVPVEFMEADGIHGNARYGAMVISRMIGLGLIARS
ncbi:MAG: hypothetical protein DI533_07540 [Cereibacter sphaeroides]|uniref:SGNH hydrolase-type esterase domain-containing protein n=1 Tax=Cereibacter sphaeroides TaxID=1063 RepID=A0A2W5UAK6_CERSP|nr:MAG: hypothetical protein DI533_07540 [Cereibacter sphaeroides]